MTLRLGGDGAITGCTSLENPDLTVSGLTISGSFDAEKVLVASGTAAAPSYTFSGDTDNGLYYAGTNSIGVATAGTAALTIDASQRVGIGTTSPSQLLHLESAAPRMRLIDSDVSTGGQISGSNGNLSLTYDILGVGGKNFSIADSTSTRLLIDSSGRLLVGTSSANDSSAQSNIIVESNSSGGTSYGGLMLRRGSTSISSGTSLGRMFFADQNGNVGARISGLGDGTWASNDYPGAITFDTVADGASSPTERMRIDSSGFVGIGDTSPGSYDSGARNLVVGSTGSTGILIKAGTSSYSNLYFGDGTGAASYRGNIAYNHSEDSLRFGAAGQERMRIDSSGRLLVGTSSSSPTIGFEPSFQVEGSSATTSSGSFLRTSNGPNPAYIALAKKRGAGNVSNGDNIGRLSFTGYDGVNYLEAATINAFVDGVVNTQNDMPGRLVFSTTADGASSPTERMRISNNGTITGAQLGSDNNNLFVARHQNSGAGTGPFFYLGYSSASTFTNGTYRYSVGTNGDVKNSNNSYGSISDIKLKENIVDANSQWSDIKALQVRRYNFKEETGYETYTQIGLVAQEVELVSPGLVSDIPDMDSEGSGLGTVTKTVNYSVLYMKAVKALQEAMDRIETLEAKVAALEAS